MRVAGNSACDRDGTANLGRLIRPCTPSRATREIILRSLKQYDYSNSDESDKFRQHCKYRNLQVLLPEDPVDEEK